MDALLPKPFRIGPTRYIAIRSSKESFTHGTNPPSYVTVFHLHEGCASVEEDWVRDTIAEYQKLDDVFRTDFLSGVIFVGSPKVEITFGASRLLHSLGTRWVELADSNSGSSPLPGLYHVIEKQLYEIWKLYEDSQDAFLIALIPGIDNRLTQLRIGGESIQTTDIAVPSRIRTTPSPALPLRGWRVAVKDIFQIEGIKTSVCNRAFYELYPPASQTAACVKILEQKGAHVVGTTKLASFAATEEPIECVDYQAPWNPRADGHQSPAGSSSGSGVAVASYDWIDIAIGSDTSGSGRRPGHWSGCFAHRPSHGVLPVEGYIPSFEQFDVPTFFGRTVEICKEFSEHWYGDKLPRNQPSLPPAIIYPIEFMKLITNKDQLKIIDDFTTDLENSLGVKHQKVSFSEVWAINPPLEVKGESLQEYMKGAGRNSFFYADYHHFDKFREDYYREFKRTLYISPSVRWQWYMTPRYRDEPLGNYFNPVGIPMLFVAPVLKAPEFTVPIGDIARDCLVKAGRPTSVLAGKKLFQ